MSGQEKSETAKREEEILAFWKRDKTFEKSLGKPAPKGEFIFYDGPPFATGLPHTGSLLSSIVKDVIPRYKTMQGYRVPRRWGWDCHGLPIESLVEKQLNLKNKKDILAIGIDTFNETARSMVLQYVSDWEEYIERVGRWVDFKNSYKTMDNSYIESVWWALKELHKKKLLYEGRKVLMYCPRCETPLAKAEIAMDNTYKDITEEAVTVKFKVKNPRKHNLPENTYLLAWTTTPWTLPGNVALAVGKDIEYGIVEKNGESYVSAASGGSLFGKDLVGVEYEPLFDVPALQSKKSYKVYAGDFVSTEEGTGIVHTAVMYGEDDFALGQKESLPMVQMLHPNGTYNDKAPEFIRGEYIKKAEKNIKQSLEDRGLLFAKENHTHSYPHCYRCGTALIYNAVSSWFINIQKVKGKMLAENEKINWVPNHLKHGRFKHIVENAPDWTISRNRFWASPLPIWKEKGGNRLMVVGSLAELKAKVKKSGNRYFVMRHGEARGNVKNIVDSNNNPENHLTEQGRRDVGESAQALAHKNKIDLIITSPSLRARETAAIVQGYFNLPEASVMVDDRLREIGFGVFDNGPVGKWKEFFATREERFSKAPDGGETYTDVQKRVGDFIFEVERRYVDKNILIVSHADPLWLLECLNYHQILPKNSETYLQPGGFHELNFVPFPHNKNFELDFHRPYIDEIILTDEAQRKYERIPEVVDCWVESGAMPYASNHYPFENRDVFNPQRFFGLFPKGFPADFIAEYIAQTRTWFYYMHAMGVLLFGRLAFKNVISTGTILAADGSKMSKSKGNYTDPLQVMHQFGADALRFHLISSVVMQAEDLNFRDEDVREAHNRVIGILWNSFKFFELYKEEHDDSVDALQSPHVLDRWILSRLGETIRDTTIALDAYNTPDVGRKLREFIDDYSTWFVRRSRDRVKSDNEVDKRFALAVQHTVLTVTAKLVAPVMPFIAESIYQKVENTEESVHLSQWPEELPIDEQLLKDMAQIRALASAGLKLRESAGIKVRQPLSTLKVKSLPQDPDLRAVLAAELNVKEVVEDPKLEAEVWLDTALTPELVEEGVVRNLIRRVQEWRKEQGLTITDRPAHTLTVSPDEREIAEKYRSKIVQETGLSQLTISS